MQTDKTKQDAHLIITQHRTQSSYLKQLSHENIVS